MAEPTTAVCTDLIPVTGTKLFVCASLPSAYDAAGYDALTWLEISMIESIGEFGPENEVGSFKPLSASRACQYMGGAQPTTFDLTAAYTKTCSGQAALMAAQGQTTAVSFKIETSRHGATGTGAKNHRFMFAGFVPKAKYGMGSGSDVMKLNASVAITGNIVEADKVDGTT